MDLAQCKAEFLRGECGILAWSASVQRTRVYRTGLTERDRSRFREAVVQFLMANVLPLYAVPIEEARHVEQIEALTSYANKIGAGVVGDAGYRFGFAQKLLNLALKYDWCLGRIPEPPHCPIDRIVISKTSLRGKLNWTAIADRSQYQRAIEAVRYEADAAKMSIAAWELDCYRRR